MNTAPKYMIFYSKHGNKETVARFYRDNDGSFVFRYLSINKVEFPGFPLRSGEYRSDSLWEAIAFRVPTMLRKQNPKTDLDELIATTSGRLVTDHFEFSTQI